MTTTQPTTVAMAEENVIFNPLADGAIYYSKLSWPLFVHVTPGYDAGTVGIFNAKLEGQKITFYSAHDSDCAGTAMVTIKGRL